MLEVQTRMQGSKQIITYFRCQEPGYGDEPMHVREFVETEDGVIWTLYVKTKNEMNEDAFVVFDKGKLSINFIPIVPFITGRRDCKRFMIYPPMSDAADLQLPLYQNESALE